MPCITQLSRRPYSPANNTSAALFLLPSKQESRSPITTQHTGSSPLSERTPADGFCTRSSALTPAPLCLCRHLSTIKLLKLQSGHFKSQTSASGCTSLCLCPSTTTVSPPRLVCTSVEHSFVAGGRHSHSRRQAAAARLYLVFFIFYVNYLPAQG